MNSGDYNILTAEAGRILGMSQDTVALWADRGLIHHRRSPGGWRMFRRSDLDAFARTLARSS